MALCDNQSAPEFTHAPCTPNSDSNIFDGADPAQPDYIGRHPGTAFLELQFYPPGWAPFGDGGISCDATQWCAAMAIFSFNSDQNTGTANNDLSTHRTGSMTASVANGFAQVNFDPTAATCTQTPYAFRPMYSTASEHTRVPWAAHSYSVAFSDEIGHFEYSANVNANGTCAGDPSDPNGPDGDDVGCFGPDASLRVRVGGTHIPGTTNTFGGNSAAAFGPLVFFDYPGPGFPPIHRTNDFRQVLPNPCRRS